MPNWNQPICGGCWKSRHPTRQPGRVRNAPSEQCCYCGEETDSGIYVKADPLTVPFPKKEQQHHARPQ